MRHRTLALAVLIAGCAAPAASEPRVAATPAASSPAEGELARLQAEFRSGDRDLGDLLAESPPPSCDRVDSLGDNLGRITARICELSSRRDAHRSIPGVPCRYAWARGAKLREQAKKLRCPLRCRGYGDLLVAYCS